MCITLCILQWMTQNCRNVSFQSYRSRRSKVNLNLATIKVSRVMLPPEAPGENPGLWSPWLVATLPPSPLQCSPERFCLYPSPAWSLGGHFCWWFLLLSEFKIVFFSTCQHSDSLFSPCSTPIPSPPLPFSFFLPLAPPPPTSHHGQITLHPSEVQQAQS